MEEILQRNINTITTLEIAGMMEISHRDVLNKLQGTVDKNGNIKQTGIIPVLTKANFRLSDYFIPSTYKDTSGKENKCYNVTKLGCDFLANKFTGEKGILFTARYVKRFDEMEQKIKNPFNLPATYKEALIQLLEQVEKNEQLEEERKTLLPKSDYHDKVLNKKGLITTTVIAKDLGFRSAARLNQVMYLNRILFKDKSGTWCPYAGYEWLLKKGFADYQSYKNEKSKPCLKWTEKGRKWIVENYNQWVNNLTA